MEFHLAQANIAKARAPMDDPIMKGFVDQLASINAVADAAEGFVWRLQSEGTGNATDLQPFDDPQILINMSVWRSVEALQAYVYNSAHATVFRNRTEWFERMAVSTQVMWWIEQGHIPTVYEAKIRLALLAREGPTKYAFTFKNNFPHP